jgi:hypothetical protein
VLVFLTVAGGRWADARSRLPVNDAAAAIELLPASIGAAQPVGYWKNPLGGSLVEEGALYSAAGSKDSIQLDFLRNSMHPHNGAGCYLTQGERFLSQALKTVQTRNGTAVFDVVLTRAERQLRVTAASECRVDGCTENVVEFGAPWRYWDFKTLFYPDRRPVVPISIVLLRDVQDVPEAQMPEEQQRLLQEFQKLLEQFDPTPAQRLATALGAASRS